MKKYSIILAIVAIMAAFASCKKSTEASTPLYSVEIPVGYEKQSTDVPGLNEYALLLGDKDQESILCVLGFPFEGNTEIILHNQTFGGANPALVNMNFTSDITPFTYGSVSGHKVDMEGIVEGEHAIGAAYCFESDGATVFLYSLGKDKATPDVDKKVIESLKVSKEFMESFDDKDAVETVVKMARINIPTPVDEITTWSDIKVDHKTKEVVLIMSLSGSSADYENVDQALDMMRPGMVENLRLTRDSDWLISVPATNGYSVGYDYVTTDDNKVIATLRILPAELLN